MQHYLTWVHWVYMCSIARFQSDKHPRYDLVSNPRIVTFLDMIEWAVARPSLIIKMNFELGKISRILLIDLNVKGSLLHSLGAVSPCLAIILNMYAPKASFKTSLVIFASESRWDSSCDFIIEPCMPRILGITLVSSPHLISGWASSMALASVVPLLGTPPTHMMGTSLSNVTKSFLVWPPSWFITWTPFCWSAA